MTSCGISEPLGLQAARARIMAMASSKAVSFFIFFILVDLLSISSPGILSDCPDTVPVYNYFLQRREFLRKLSLYCVN